MKVKFPLTTQPPSTGRGYPVPRFYCFDCVRPAPGSLFERFDSGGLGGWEAHKPQQRAIALGTTRSMSERERGTEGVVGLGGSGFFVLIHRFYVPSPAPLLVGPL